MSGIATVAFDEQHRQLEEWKTRALRAEDKVRELRVELGNVEAELQDWRDTTPFREGW